MPKFFLILLRHPTEGKRETLRGWNVAYLLGMESVASLSSLIASSKNQWTMHSIQKLTELCLLVITKVTLIIS